MADREAAWTSPVGASVSAPRALTRLVAAFSAAAGVALAALGQALTSRDLDERLGFLSRPASYLKDVYPRHQPSILFGAILMATGAVLFALGTRSAASDDGLLPADGGAPRLAPRLASGRLLVLGGLAWLYLTWRLWRDDYSAALPPLFVACLVCVGVAVLLASRHEAVERPRWRGLPYLELALVVAAVVYFLVANIRDIDSWRYAAIGDEYPFFAQAKGMADGVLKANVFSQLGVWQQRPVGTSEVQALSMRVFGADSYGWHIATPIALAAAIPAVYLTARVLFDRTVAAFAALVFATSHYLMGYTHTGYDNVFAITPFAWCVALAVLGLRRGSATWMYLAGVAGGLGFYTFPTARMAPVVVALFIASLGARAWKPAWLIPFAAGLCLAALPLFASDGWRAISVSQGRTVFGFTDSPNEGVGIRLLENVPRTLLGFNENPNPVHFTSGSLLDPVAAVLLVLGVGYGVSRITRPAHRLLAIWLAATLFFAGILSPYDRVAVDRLHLALPPASIYAGMAVGALIAAGARSAPLRRVRPGYAAAGVFLVLAPVLAYVNLHRFYVESPRVTPTTEERIALGGLSSAACRGDGAALLVVRTPAPLLKPALAAIASRREIGTRATPAAAGAEDYGRFDCVVVTRLRHPSDEEMRGAVTLTCEQSCWREAQAAIDHIERDFGFHEADIVWMPTAHFEGVVLVP